VLFFNAAAAVAAFVTDPAGRVLYVRRSRDPGKGRLGMPGGFVDPGETAEEALLREVREEVGLDIGPLTYLGSWPNRYLYRDVVYTTLDLFFVAPAVDPASAQPLDAVDRIEWLAPARVDPGEIAFDSMRAALERYLASAAR
jgi:8-oxo-dGTP pyrophosphatase MutT (NUDIX family)